MKTDTNSKSFPPFPPVDPLEKAIRQALDRRIEAIPDSILYGQEFDRTSDTPIAADSAPKKNGIIAFYDDAFELLDPGRIEFGDAPPSDDNRPTIVLFRFWMFPYADTTEQIWEKTAIFRRIHQTRWAFRLLPCTIRFGGIPCDKYWRVHTIWEDGYGNLQPDIEL